RQRGVRAARPLRWPVAVDRHRAGGRAGQHQLPAPGDSLATAGRPAGAAARHALTGVSRRVQARFHPNSTHHVSPGTPGTGDPRMTPMLLSLMQAATVEPLPEDAVSAGTDVAQALPPAITSDGGLDMLQLVVHASLTVQLVILLLLFASIASWVIIFRKTKVLGRAEREAEAFEERFWSGTELTKLYAGTTSRNRDTGGMESIFEAGFREFSRQRRVADVRMQLETAQRGMRVASARELDGLERNLEFLANVGSIAPYVGLFGTVWGIMISFQGLANVTEATIASVAPGISEALIATAMGLFAAIPAVWAYNRFATKVERIAVRYD